MHNEFSKSSVLYLHDFEVFRYILFYIVYTETLIRSFDFKEIKNVALYGLVLYLKYQVYNVKTQQDSRAVHSC